MMQQTKAPVLAQRNIPRYLYHLTNKKNYNSMLSSGVIKVHHDADETTMLNGVFMFDMINFVKRWCNVGLDLGKIYSELAGKKLSLAKALFIRTSINDSNLVLLKIPSKLLDKNKLRCRTQELEEGVVNEHSNYGDLAYNRKHYTRKRKAIEYIYEDNIPIANAINLGEIDSGLTRDKFDVVFAQDENLPFILLKEILSNQPEIKSVELGEKSSIPFSYLI